MYLYKCDPAYFEAKQTPCQLPQLASRVPCSLTLSWGVSNTRRDRGRVVSFNGDDGRWSLLLGVVDWVVESGDRMAGCWSVTCSSVIFWATYESIEPKHDATEKTSWSHVSGAADAVAGAGQVFLDKQIRPMNRSAGCSLLTWWKIIRWCIAWKLKGMKKEY